MTMAAAASKQGIILGRLWKALLLSRSKRLKENKKLMKRPKRAKKGKKKKEENCPPIFSGKRPFIWVLTSILIRILKDHILVFWTIIWSFNFPPPEGKNKKTIFLVSVTKIWFLSSWHHCRPWLREIDLPSPSYAKQRYATRAWARSKRPTPPRG